MPHFLGNVEYFTERVKPFAVANDHALQAQWSEKKWVWITDKEQGYLSAHILKETGDKLLVKLADDTERTVNLNDTEKMNPPKFDKVEDMAELTYLNEASVVHNLRLRYLSNLIYVIFLQTQLN